MLKKAGGRDMKSINRRTAICLIISLLLGIIYVSPISVAKKKPILSQKIVTMNGNETKTITILNLKKKYIKSVKAVNQFREIVDVKIQNKTNIIITSSTTWNNAFPWIAIKLNRKVGGKKHYELGFKVEVKGGEETIYPSTVPTYPTTNPTNKPWLTISPIPTAPVISPAVTIKPSVTPFITPTTSISPSTTPAVFPSIKPTLTPDATSITTPSIAPGSTVYIDSAEKLYNLEKELDSDKNLTFILQSDLDMSGTDEPLSGIRNTFDGNGHKIKNLSHPFVSFNEGIIKNIQFTDVKMDGDFFFSYLVELPYNATFQSGVIACVNRETIENCSTTGFAYYNREFDKKYIKKILNYEGPNDNHYINFGGICGYNTGEILKCKNNLKITAIVKKIVDDYTFYETTYIGGICGKNDYYISECINSGFIDNSLYISSAYYGGIVGYAVGKIYDSYSVANNYLYLCGADLHAYFESTYAVINDGFQINNGGSIFPLSEIVDINLFNECSNISGGFDFDNIWIMTPNGPDLKWNQ